MPEQQESPSTRSAYLLDGRRVTVSDLIGSGLLSAGSTLRFKRPRKGQAYSAVVTRAGAIALDGGQEFKSPSRAAAVAADIRAMDGWHAWTVASSGRSLDSLRVELLEQVAAGAAEDIREPGSSLRDPERRYERLKEARSRADAKDPEEITVRKLLELWDAQARGPRINQRIEADLANHGLTTSPSFRSKHSGLSPGWEATAFRW
jgi:hypothetical protein